MRLTRRGEIVLALTQFVILLITTMSFLAIGTLVLALWFGGQR